MKRSFFQKILFYLSVPKCVGCAEKLDIDDFGLCKKCEENFIIKSDRNCSRCAKRINECSCAPKYLKDNRIKNLAKCFRYIINDNNASHNNLIFSLKKDNRYDVLEKLSNMLADSIRSSYNDFHDYIITNVPRRKRSIKQYGMDHSAMLAKATAKKLNIKYKSMLISKSEKMQKSLRGDERIKNAKFILKRNVNPQGLKIIIIDDIVTTGASIVGCANALKQGRVKKIVAACIAIAYKDEYTPPKKEYVSFL